MTENWIANMEELLNEKTQKYSEQEKVNISYSFLIGLLQKISQKAIILDSIACEKIEHIIMNLPDKTNGKKINLETLRMNEISNLKTHLHEQYKFIRKGYYKTLFLPLGAGLGCLGLPLGVIMGNIALGLAIGIPIGLGVAFIFGTILDRKAEMANRVI